MRDVAPALRRFRVSRPGGRDQVFRLADLLSANTDDDAVIERLPLMRPGEAQVFGGGAYASVVVERVA